MAHCRTAEHVAAMHGADRDDVLRMAKILKALRTLDLNDPNGIARVARKLRIGEELITPELLLEVFPDLARAVCQPGH